MPASVSVPVWPLVEVPVVRLTVAPAVVPASV
jgi:hypothetical protein